MNCFFATFASLVPFLRSCPSLLYCPNRRGGRSVCCIWRRQEVYTTSRNSSRTTARRSSSYGMETRNNQDNSIIEAAKSHHRQLHFPFAAVQSAKRARRTQGDWTRPLCTVHATSDAVVTQENQDDLKDDKTRRKKNRPGYNTYLKVVLDDSTIHNLYQTTMELQKAVLALTTRLRKESHPDTELLTRGTNNESTEDGAECSKQTSVLGKHDTSSNAHTSSVATKKDTASSETAATTIMPATPNEVEENAVHGTYSPNPSKDMDVINDYAGKRTNNKSTTSAKMPRKALHVQPRSLTSLHMTLFFGGEVICNDLTREELQTWYNSVQDRLRKSDFCTKKIREEREASSNDEDNDDFRRDMWFRISDVRTFPPRRNYLIVAVLEASPAWIALHDDLRNIASSSSCAALQEITKYSKETWTPHITLANLRGGNASEKKELRELLKQFSNQPRMENRDTLYAESVCLGGPLPSQLELDWNFLCGKDASEERGPNQVSEKDGGDGNVDIGL